MRSRRYTWVLAVLLALVAAACVPTFPSGSSARVVQVGGVAYLQWDAAKDGDVGGYIDRYRIDIDGVQRATIPADTRSCALVGLAAGTTYQLVVTAYDGSNEYSGGSSSGKLTVDYTAAKGAGGTPGCTASVDTDGDRLPDSVETGTGHYVSASDTGTNPNVADSDGDGIGDGDEVLGTLGGLDLPALGASPVHKDLLFEFDWFDDSVGCGAHSHRPTSGAISRLTSAFAAGPVANPDGVTGVHVIADYGQGGAFTGGNAVPDADGVIAGGVNGSDFNAIKAANFAANRQGYVHYVLMPHYYNTNSTSSGQAEINGNDLVVSLYCAGSDTNVANTIMHEVGHNLGLRHSGDTDLPNYEPNYNSVMNYRYQFPGVDTDCTVPGNGVLSYSTGSRASLDENALVESAGICNSVAVDWNGNSTIDVGTVKADVNNGDGLYTAQTDWNDWAHLNFGGLTSDSDGAAPNSPTATEVVTEQPVPPAFR